MPAAKMPIGIPRYDKLIGHEAQLESEERSQAHLYPFIETVQSSVKSKRQHPTKDLLVR